MSMKYMVTPTKEDANLMNITNKKPLDKWRSNIMLKRASVAFLIAFVGMGICAFARADNPQDQSNVFSYVVLLKGDPVLGYGGGILGYSATRPTPGRKLDPASRAVRQYVRFLEDQHTKTLTAVGAQADSKVYSYTYVINGFAAMLTKAQAVALTKRPEVLWVAATNLSSSPRMQARPFSG
jgi:hypothetical protein